MMNKNHLNTGFIMDKLKKEHWGNESFITHFGFSDIDTFHSQIFNLTNRNFAKKLIRDINKNDPKKKPAPTVSATISTTSENNAVENVEIANVAVENIADEIVQTPDLLTSLIAEEKEFASKKLSTENLIKQLEDEILGKKNSLNLCEKKLAHLYNSICKIKEEVLKTSNELCEKKAELNEAKHTNADIEASLITIREKILHATVIDVYVYEDTGTYEIDNHYNQKIEFSEEPINIMAALEKHSCLEDLTFKQVKLVLKLVACYKLNSKLNFNFAFSNSDSYTAKAFSELLNTL